MTKKKNDPQEEQPREDLRKEYTRDYQNATPPAPDAEIETFYETATWKGVKTVFKCKKCGTFRDTRDEMIEHVLLHVPKAEQEEVLNLLLKEK